MQGPVIRRTPDVQPLRHLTFLSPSVPSHNSWPAPRPNAPFCALRWRSRPVRQRGYGGGDGGVAIQRAARCRPGRLGVPWRRREAQRAARRSGLQQAGGGRSRCGQRGEAMQQLAACRGTGFAARYPPFCSSCTPMVGRPPDTAPSLLKNASPRPCMLGACRRCGSAIATSQPASWCGCRTAVGSPTTLRRRARAVTGRRIPKRSTPSLSRMSRCAPYLTTSPPRALYLLGHCTPPFRFASHRSTPLPPAALHK